MERYRSDARRSGCRSEHSLDDQYLAPGAVELTVPAVKTDRIEAAALDQADARDVIGEQLADQLVKLASSAAPAGGRWFETSWMRRRVLASQGGISHESRICG